MVVFTCNNCGETLQKPKVAKHYEFQCRSAPFLTCVDCFKDFRGEEYVVHTKCKSEAERYGGKDYVPKAGANKGERKQQAWINVVNSLLDSETNLSTAERNFLNTLSKYENIPRKKNKFLNFIKNAVGHRANQSVVNSVWDKMETAFKNSTQSTNTQNEKQQQENGKTSEKVNNGEDANTQQENNIVENQNNENLDRENQNEDHLNKNKVNGMGNADADTVNNVKKKKSKKRTVSEIVEQADEPIVKKKSKHAVEAIEEPVSKKKNEDIVMDVPTKKSEDTLLSETSINHCDDTVEKSTFNWRDTILDIVKSKGEISLKKLQKKVLSRYMNSCSNNILEEKASNKFNKKLKKISEITISDEKVTLA
ncbi:uncharacterized protein [Bombus fervidus]|uniref:uncharacterized protein n=1 Tax=Bombus fervidus TaxID=203811 RepID=UPI003AB6CAB8